MEKFEGALIPNHNAFDRLGRKAEKVAKVLAYCSTRDDLNDVRDICLATNVPVRAAAPSGGPGRQTGDGFVYLIKMGKVYKIGFSSSPGRREYELGTETPEKPELVHKVATDDVRGIVAYWHRRFADRHVRGEWYALSPADVKAFICRKHFMWRLPERLTQRSALSGIASCRALV